MKNKITLLLFILCTLALQKTIYAQGVLPAFRYDVKKTLSVTPVPFSFGFSLRKLNNAYTGACLRARNGTNNAQADVAFNLGSNVVSDSSIVTITAVGTGPNAIGSKVTLNTFRGAANMFVTIWYDQGGTGLQAIQNTTASQPQLVLNSAGANLNKPSILFNNTAPGQFLDINTAITNVLGAVGAKNAVLGSFLLWTRPTQNSNQESFGAWSSTSTSFWRWSFHINWSDNNCYFDAAEPCCATNRSFLNNTNIGLYKQYTFIRGDTYKTVRINQTATSLLIVSAHPGRAALK